MSTTLETEAHWAGARAVAKYLDTPDGRSAVHRVASKYRLGGSCEDELRALVEDAALSMDLAGKPIDSAAGFATRVLQRRGVDLVRGQIRRRNRFGPEASPAEDGDDAVEVVGQDDPALSGLEVEAQFQELRRVVLDPRLEARAWQRSALLTYAAIRADLLVPGDRCVRPQGGTTAHHAAVWAGLWYAGQRACLVGDGSDAAVRQARSRHMRSIGDLHQKIRSLLGGSGE